MGLSLSGLKVFSVSEERKVRAAQSSGETLTKIDDLPARESVLTGHLSGHTQRVGQLGLPSPELTEDLQEDKREIKSVKPRVKSGSTNLSDGHGLQASAEQLVELPRAGADPEDVPPVDGVLESRLEAGVAAADLHHGLLHLVHLGLRQTLDGTEPLLGHHLDPSHGADPSSLQLLDVGHVDAVALEQLDVLEEIFLLLVESLGLTVTLSSGGHFNEVFRLYFCN